MPPSYSEEQLRAFADRVGSLTTSCEMCQELAYDFANADIGMRATMMGNAEKGLATGERDQHMRVAAENREDALTALLRHMEESGHKPISQ